MGVIESIIKSTRTYKRTEEMFCLERVLKEKCEKQICELLDELDETETKLSQAEKENERISGIAGFMISGTRKMYMDSSGNYICATDTDLEQGAKVKIEIKQDAPRKGLRIYCRTEELS